MSRAPRFDANLAKARDRALSLAIKTRSPVVVLRSGMSSFLVISEAQAETDGHQAQDILVRVEAR